MLDLVNKVQMFQIAVNKISTFSMDPNSAGKPDHPLSQHTTCGKKPPSQIPKYPVPGEPDHYHLMKYDTKKKQWYAEYDSKFKYEDPKVRRSYTKK